MRVLAVCWPHKLLFCWISQKQKHLALYSKKHEFLLIYIFFSNNYIQKFVRYIWIVLSSGFTRSQQYQVVSEKAVDIPLFINTHKYLIVTTSHLLMKKRDNQFYLQNKTEGRRRENDSDVT